MELFEDRIASHPTHQEKSSICLDYGSGHNHTQLKKAFTSAPILAHIDPEKPFTIEADASDFALQSILSQARKDGQSHPVTFHSRKIFAVEINYEVHDKE